MCSIDERQMMPCFDGRCVMHFRVHFITIIFRRVKIYELVDVSATVYVPNTLAGCVSQSMKVVTDKPLLYSPKLLLLELRSYNNTVEDIIAQLCWSTVMKK